MAVQLGGVQLPPTTEGTHKSQQLAGYHAKRSQGQGMYNGSPFVGQTPGSPFVGGQTPDPMCEGIGFHLSPAAVPNGMNCYGAKSVPLAAVAQEIQQQNGIGKSVPMNRMAQEVRQQHGTGNHPQRTRAATDHSDHSPPRRDQRGRSPKGSIPQTSTSPREQHRRNSAGTPRRDVSPSQSGRDVTPCPPRERAGTSPRHSTKSSLVPYGMGRHSHPENSGATPVGSGGSPAKRRPKPRSITMPEAPEASSAQEITTELYCNEGHLMRAKVVREVWNRISWWHYQTDCDVCGERITSKHARYCCKECRYSVCMNCTAKMLAVNRKAPKMKLPPTASFNSALSDSGPCPARVLPGDVLLVGPDKWGIHHAVLIVGRMKRETEAAALIKCDWPEIQHMDIYSCPTIESTGQSKGEHTVWYPAMYFFARDPRTKDALLVADMPQGSNEIELCQEMPVKLLLHPCRPGHAGPPLDLTMFRRSVKLGAIDSQNWSLKTAARGIMSRRKGASRLSEKDFPDEASRRKMMDDVHKRWQTRPICTSVIIMVWQRYFELVAGQGDDAVDLAAKYILKWMPLLCDSTLPSALIKELTNCSWVMRGNIDA